MNIGLIDVDGHNFPNLALMKISAYHKAKGDNVEFINPLLPYDVVYQSKVFDFTQDFFTCIRADLVIKGGRAYNKKLKLPAEIEQQYPDYSLYHITDTAYGYLTRGCPRGCPFCDVVNIEGQKSHKVADLSQFWRGQKYIKLLDPNLLACPEHEDLLKQLIKSGAWVDFTQGLDARLLNQDNINLINKLKVKMIHFAWDNPDDEITPKKLQEFKKQSKIDMRRLRVYVLTNYNSTHEQDLYRIYKLREMGYDPYVMIYNKQQAPKETRYLQRWVNNILIWRSCARFEDYDPKLG